jgi:hypothetical protein
MTQFLSKYKKIFLAILGVLILSALYFTNLGRTDARVIVLKNDGFHPSNLTINKNETVFFKTERNRPFWPASDEHPTHSIYPEFDAKAPVDANNTWSFTFTRAGEFRFHDHLSPSFLGTIKVTGDEAVTAACDKQKNTYSCWKEDLLSILDDKGLSAAFDRIEELYNSDQQFAAQCHSLAHDLGHGAYKYYLKEKDAVISPRAAYCANGYYHGFMESLLNATGDLVEAHDFCLFIEDQMRGKAPDAGLQCFHGIGHGAIAMTVKAGNAKVDEESLIKPALELCERASDKDEQLYRCASGAFNSIANAYITGEYNLTIDKQNPMWLCQQQPVKYKESCYGNMNSFIYRLADNDFAKAALYVEGIPEPEYAVKTMVYLAALSTLTTAKQDPGSAVLSCRSLSKNLHTPCIQGFTHGFLEHGTPDREYEDAVRFCETPIMNEGEKETCLKYSLSSLTGWYSLDKIKVICTGLKPEYQLFCPKYE